MVSAWEAAAATPDPELQSVTAGELGIIRSVEEDWDGVVTVTLTPTYAGCPAVPAIVAGVRRRLAAAGYPGARVTVALTPRWSSDWITAEGRRKLAAAGVAPPSGPAPAPSGPASPVPLTLLPRPPAVACPRCGSSRTRLVAGFGPTPCTSLHACEACGEPFEHVKAI
jgi:ring-1,2-phenylacetyl-CoA epoxidase subunit PaaD